MVSIIIPVYNGQNFIHNAIESVCNQTYTDIEIIVVNDGSTDATEEILNQISANDERIKIITQSNGGPSKARNTGINEAEGKYIAFVDADDILPKNYIKVLMSVIDDSDMAVCGLKYNNHENAVTVNVPESNYNISEFVSDSLKGDISPIAAFTGPCARIFRMELIKDNKISFDEHYRYGEDTIFNLKYLALCKKILTTNQTHYIVNEREDSLSKSANVERFNAYKDIKKALQELLFETRLDNTEISSHASMYFVDNFFARSGEILNTAFDKQWKENQLTALLTSGIVTPSDVIIARGKSLPWRLLSFIIKKKSGKMLLLWFVLAPKMGV